MFKCSTLLSATLSFCFFRDVFKYYQCLEIKRRVDGVKRETFEVNFFGTARWSRKTTFSLYWDFPSGCTGIYITIRSGRRKIPRVNNVYVKSPNARQPDTLSRIQGMMTRAFYWILWDPPAHVPTYSKSWKFMLQILNDTRDDTRLNRYLITR